MSFTNGDSPDRLLAAVDDTMSDTPSEDLEELDEMGYGTDDEAEDDGQGNNVSTAQTTNVGGQSSAAPKQPGSSRPGFSSIIGQGSSVLPVDQTWKLNQPMPTPLSYELTSDANGGVQVYILQGNVDFADRNSVQSANEYPWQRRARACRMAGLPPLRASTIGRAITPVQHNFIIAEYHAYAAATNNRRMPNPELTRRFNARFQETPVRTPQSVAAYVHRKDDIKAVMYSYNRR